MDFQIRAARREDVAAIFEMICELAEFEKLRDKVMGTAADLDDVMFGSQQGVVKVIVAEQPAEPAAGLCAFALYFHSFSTFLCRRGIYLEDLFVRPAFRARGLGRAMLRHLAAEAVATGCGRVEWNVLRWNEVAIKFYTSVGAAPMREWETYRLDGDALAAFARGGGATPSA